MMVGKDQDLGLSLSLNFHENNTNVISHPTPIQQLNLMPCFPNKPFWANQLLPSSDRRPEIETRSFFNGIDVNSLPCAAEEDEEEEAALSSPNSGISSVSGKRSERENYNGGDRNDLERSWSRGISDEEDAENARKKLRLSKDQSAVLEESFKEHNTLNPKQKQALAKKLGLRPRQVEVWFQNRRARTKLKQTEVDCEYLKRCCETLTDENRRLQKEVQELRALKLSPQLYMQMTPPTTLTICPSCERVGAPSSDPRPHPAIGSGHQRPVPMFNPWGATPITQRPFNALRS